MITVLIPETIHQAIPLLSLYDGSALETLSTMGFHVRLVGPTLDCQGSREACQKLEELVADYTTEKLSWFPSTAK